MPEATAVIVIVVARRNLPICVRALHQHHEFITFDNSTTVAAATAAVL